jgi:hypothetical protein
MSFLRTRYLSRSCRETDSLLVNKNLLLASAVTEEHVVVAAAEVIEAAGVIVVAAEVIVEEVQIEALEDMKAEAASGDVGMVALHLEAGSRLDSKQRHQPR